MSLFLLDKDLLGNLQTRLCFEFSFVIYVYDFLHFFFFPKGDFSPVLTCIILLKKENRHYILAYADVRFCQTFVNQIVRKIIVEK